ncbi:hypothetical protein D9M71_568140 [compost metagenome]
MAAGQCDRSGQQAHQRVEPQRRGQADTHGVLHQQQAGHYQQEHHHHAPAFFQAGEICTQTDGGEERQHQWCLQRGIELHMYIETAQRQKRQGYYQAARDGFRDVIGAQEANARDKTAPQ